MTDYVAEARALIDRLDADINVCHRLAWHIRGIGVLSRRLLRMRDRARRRQLRRATFEADALRLMRDDFPGQNITIEGMITEDEAAEIVRRSHE